MSKKNKSIYIMSTKKGSGKTATVIGLYKNIEEYKKNPGYFKPIGDPFNDVITKTEKYVNIIHKVLKRKYSKDEISPIFISPTSFLDEIPLEEVDDIKTHIKNTFKISLMKQMLF
ncbi:MAG: AAA family ATPase [Methanobacterium sp.]|nr:AAA family ATPase [Methanobacterium sp.]